MGPVVVAGDSAGGGLALATALAARQLQLSPPAALILLSPWVDLTTSMLSDKAARHEAVLSRAWLAACARHYLAAGDPKAPLASPIYGDLHGLPPTLIQAGADELLHSDAVRVHDALTNAGVAVRCEIVPGFGMAFTFTPACCRPPMRPSSGLGALSRAASRRRFSTRFAKMPMKRGADEPCRMVILAQGGDERAARYRSVPLQRRWMNDIVHFGKKSHIMGCAWQINVAPLVAARAAQQRQQQPVIGWTAMWLKALALVSQRRPELRTLYLPFPWARLYVRPESVGTIVIERTWQGVSALFFEQFAAPEKRSLLELDDALRKLKQAPVESVGSFRRLIRISRLPVVLRRLIWSFGAQLVGAAARQIYGDLRAQSVSGRWQYHPIGDAGRVHAVLRPHRAERRRANSNFLRSSHHGRRRALPDCARSRGDDES